MNPRRRRPRPSVRSEDRSHIRTGAERALPLLPFRLWWLGLGAAAAVACAASLLLAGYAARGELGGGPRRVTATPPAPESGGPLRLAAGDDGDAVPALGVVTFDESGQYAFPIAADPDLFTWTHFHWDGSHAVDVELRFGLSFAQFVAVSNAQLIAVTGGTALDYSGSVGGRGYMLQGDDGRDYYYAHMSDQWVPDGARVAAGQPLGVMGNTGGSAQFIEPHLHLAIGPRDSLWDRAPRLNAAEWLQATFGLGWADRPTLAVPPETPRGRPVEHPEVAVVTSFEQASAGDLPQAAIEFGFPGGPPDSPLEVRAPLAGTINVIRWTAHYGTRIQIHNPGTDSTVVISGVDSWRVQDGDLVSRGDVVGLWEPSKRPRLHYIIYRRGEIVDPTPTLELDPGEET